MVDIHCHILPGIDDGSKNVVDSIAIIKEQVTQNIDKLIFTPHFNIENTSLEDFLIQRENALNNLIDYSRQINYTIPVHKCAAEVYLTPKLLECDFAKLCIQDTDYMLLELPTNYYRPWTQNVLFRLRLAGVNPILAHIERYPFFESNLDILYEIANSGVIMQINAGSFLHKKQTQKLVNLYLKHNFVQVIASDTHSLSKRPPMLGKAFETIGKDKNGSVSSMLIKNAENIFAGDSINSPYPTKIKTLFGIHI